MPKKKAAEPATIKLARQVMKTADSRSLEYKEAAAIVQEFEDPPVAEDLASDEAESDESMETDESEDEDDAEEEEEEDDEDDEGEEDESPAADTVKGKTTRGKGKSVANTKAKQTQRGGKIKKAVQAKAKKTVRGKAISKRAPKKATGVKKCGKKKPLSKKPTTIDYTKGSGWTDSENEYFLEAKIGGGFKVELSKWLRNGAYYVSIRKAGTPGVVLSLDKFENLKKAITGVCAKLSELEA